ncbi:DNA primase [Streptomyces sp. SYSU K217416]
MNNRLVMGLAVGAGYVLGRTKKAKLAFGIGTLIMGKKLQLNPKALAEFATSQLQNNPQFKEIGDQLREDMRGVGKAATGALVNRQLEGLADRLHDRTQGVQDRLSGAVTGAPDRRGEDDDEAESGRAEQQEEREPQEAREERPAPRKKAAARKTAPARKSAPARKAAPAKRAAKSTAKGGRDRA